MESKERLITVFFERIKEDPRISTAHICLYMGLLHLFAERSATEPIRVFRRDLIPYCKISGPALFHRAMRELHQYGYIFYEPSFYPRKGSRIWMVATDKLPRFAGPGKQLALGYRV
jgi:hypothetical protein